MYPYKFNKVNNDNNNHNNNNNNSFIQKRTEKIHAGLIASFIVYKNVSI